MVYLNPYIWTHTFGPIYFDYSFLTILLEQSIWTRLIHDNLVLALGHRVQPFAFTHVRLSTDIVANLGLVKPEHLLLQGESGEGALRG